MRSLRPFAVSLLLLAAPLAPPACAVASPIADDFYIFGWVSPPAESTTAARMDEMAEAGMNLVLPALEDSGRVEDNLRRLDLAAARGMRCIVLDMRLARFVMDDPKTFAVIDTVAASYRGHPAFLAYYVGDEPPLAAFPFLEQLFPAIRARDPEHPPWQNLAGPTGFETHDQWIAHHQLYLSKFHPAVLCNDHYDFVVSGDRHRFIENAVGLNALARAAGIPFWSFVQLIDHGPYRVPSRGELRWQVSMLLAYGARGIGYFTYWQPREDPRINWGTAIIGFDGRRTGWFPFISRWNRLVRAAGSTLAKCEWRSTVHAGGVPNGGQAFVPNDWVSAVEGRAVLGFFTDVAGTPHVLVVNSDSAFARPITLTLPGTERACVLDETHDTWGAATCVTPQASRLTLILEAGSLALVRLEGPVAGVDGRSAPQLAIVPNPASSAVRFALRRAVGEATLEIVDTGGRRAWSRTIATSETGVSWNGEREGGGRVRPGVYFARLRDARGVTTARVVWLGGS